MWSVGGRRMKTGEREDRGLWWYRVCGYQVVGYVQYVKYCFEGESDGLRHATHRPLPVSCNLLDLATPEPLSPCLSIMVPVKLRMLRVACPVRCLPASS